MDHVPQQPPQKKSAIDASERRWILPACGLTMLSLASFAYWYAPSAYFLTLQLVMQSPQTSPFIDAKFIPDMVDCWNRGVNVYVTAPCDPLHRVFAYSPLWLRIGFFTAWSNWMGIALEFAFFASLSILPPPRTPRAIAFMILALCSSMTAFALERGNIDIVMFLLIIAGGWCWMRGLKLRLIGYSIFTIAGLLKFYPLVLFSLFIHERIGLFIALCFAGTAAMAGFVWCFHIELHEMAANLPKFSYFSDVFGSVQLPGGLETWFVHLLRRANARTGILAWPFLPRVFFAAMWLMLTACCIGNALRLATDLDFLSAYTQLTSKERGFLLIGAALFCGCFFAVTNNSYRGIHFLFVLPGMLALANSSAGRVFRITVAAILFIMWGLTAQFLLVMFLVLTGHQAHDGLAERIYWLIHALTWWWVISVLLAVLFCFVRQTAVWRTLTQATRPACNARKT